MIQGPSAYKKMNSPRAWTTKIGIGIAAIGVVGLAAQFVRPELKNPPVTADLQAPPEVKRILAASCYNCHSNETKLSWFDQIEPGYALVVHDVREARAHLNFSDFGALPPAQQKAFLYEGVNRIRFGVMPPKSYLALHPGAQVAAPDLKVLEDYLHPPESRAAELGRVPAAAAPAELTGLDHGAVPPAPNGIPFFADYATWKLVSATDRFDNGTLRSILGNEVAIRAIALQQNHPWPDGTAFAKVAWKQRRDAQGVVRPGEFVQVELMLKDATKYAATEGWGFARWRGASLVPYGKDKGFTSECASCHAPMRANDFVFTEPIRATAENPDAFNGAAALPPGLPADPLQGEVITSSVDATNAAMATEFGNGVAASHARTGGQAPYPAGSVLYVVTWRQQDDAHWFGGRIAAKVMSVESVTVEDQPDGALHAAYGRYPAGSGGPANDVDRAARMEQILQQEPATFR